MPYKDPEVFKKKYRIRRWIKRGLVCDNIDELYEYFDKTNNCEKCNVELTEGSRCHSSKVMDHCHITGEFRNVLCHHCNASLPRVKKTTLN